MSKKLIKLATVRDKQRVCPFGLPITDGCKCAGNSLGKMTPIMQIKKDFDVPVVNNKEALQEIIESNIRIMIWDNQHNEQGAQCKFANIIFEGKDKVECGFGDESNGLGHVDFSPIPSYTSYFSSGYAAVPIGFYSEHPVRNQGGGFEQMMSTSFASEEEDGEKIKK